MKKTVIVVENNKSSRKQLLQILKSTSDIKCLGAYTSGEQAIPKILEKKPDVVLMDIKLRGMSGIQCVAEIKKSLPGGMQIIMVSAYKDSKRIFHALMAGADGYLVKPSSPEQLIHAIRDACAGGAPMSSHIARKVVQYFHLSNSSVQEAENLTLREREVLSLLASGFIYKEIGSKLNIGDETVRTHIKKICKKMHVCNRIEAVARHWSESLCPKDLPPAPHLSIPERRFVSLL